MDFVQRIYDFNKESGLLDKPYDDYLESAFQIEEALEGFDHLRFLGESMEETGCEPLSEYSPKHISREIVLTAQQGPYQEMSQPLSDVDRLDKHIDSLIYDIGSMAKLNLTPEQICRAIHVVMEVNETKKLCKKDELGKLGKPADFVGPEAELQKILDERG